MAAKTIAEGTWTLRADNTLTVISDSGKKVTCTPAAEYHYKEGTQLSHDVDFLIRHGEFIEFRAHNTVETPTETSAESTVQAKTGPTLRAALIALKHKAVHPQMIAKLRNLAAQTKAMRQLDIRNQVTPPDDPKERLAIWDALPPELRELFADECKRHDAMKGRRHDA